MAPKLSKFESEVNRLLEASTPISTISTLFKISKISIYNTISRIKKKNTKSSLKRASSGRIKKLSSREKRVINRDLTKQPKKSNSSLLAENNLKITKRTLQRFLN